MTKRWLEDDAAPRSAKLIESLPRLSASDERRRLLHRQLMNRLQRHPPAWLPGGSAMRPALAVIALAGSAAATALGIRALGSGPPEPAPEPPSQPRPQPTPTVTQAEVSAPVDPDELLIEAVRALKRDADPERARQLATRYLRENPEGSLAREAREVLSQAGTGQPKRRRQRSDSVQAARND